MDQFTKTIKVPHCYDKCLYENPDYEVFHLSNHDKYFADKILITNRKLENDDGDDEDDQSSRAKRMKYDNDVQRWSPG